ncbi:MAG: hypothetical protein JW862_15665 [Anaerolineales bacterium]|nr:hypothetical protein [Anaerolineales bacterium]
MAGLIHSENRATAPLCLGDQTITLIEKDLRLQPPGLWGMLFWRRPAAVVVERPGERPQVLPIPDLTRIVQWSLLGAGLLVAFILWLLSLSIKESN